MRVIMATVKDRFDDFAEVSVEDEMVCVRAVEDNPRGDLQVAYLDLTPKRARKLAKVLKKAARAAEQS